MHQFFEGELRVNMDRPEWRELRQFCCCRFYEEWGDGANFRANTAREVRCLQHRDSADYEYPQTSLCADWGLWSSSPPVK